MVRLRPMLPLVALGLAAMLGGCVAYPAYPDYPAYGYGYAAPGYYVGGYHGGEHGGEHRGEYRDEHGGGWRR